MTRSEYRPDIDGLRAIAVLSVLVHHICASILPGGFVGVDIFFVISGYLITLQVYRETREGTFSVKQFYKRRINRIVPALLTATVATVAVGYVVLSPNDLVRLAKSAVLATVGLSNIFFWRAYGNYFAGNAGEAPLLHTWSLGVEEQFYVIWPVLIAVLCRLDRRYVFGVLAILTAGAVALSEIGVQLVASASYYLLPTRFFELMAGGVTALGVAHKQHDSSHLARASFSAGILLIGGSLLWLGRSSTFPGIHAIWPCLGTALVIYSGSGKHFRSRMLTSRPLVSVGLISYSLYLWHWPIIAYLNYLDIPIGTAVGTCVALGSISLAWLSWKFVEVPMRHSGATWPFSKVLVQRFAIPAAALLAIGGSTIYTKGAPERFDPRVAQFEQALDSRPEVLRGGCHVPTAMYDTPPNPVKCRLGAKKPGLDGILIGDSFANHFSGMVDVLAKGEGLSLMDYTMDGCPPILGYMTDNSPTYAERCRRRNEAAFKLISTNHYARVILAGNWPTAPGVGRQLMNSMDAVLSTGAKLTLIMSNEGIDRANSCPIRNIMYGTTKNCDSPRGDPPAYFTEIRSRYPNVQIIDPNEVICGHGMCDPVMGGTPLYRDSAHLDDIGSRLIGEALARMGVTI